MFDRRRLLRTVLAATLVAVIAALSTFVWWYERSAFERSVREARLDDPLPIDAAFAAETLAARVAFRYCYDIAVESHFEVDDYTGGDGQRVYVPKCLRQPERTPESLDMTGVRAYVTTGDIPQMFLEGNTRCLAVPGGDVRYLIAYSPPGEGYRCPNPGCECPIPPPMQLQFEEELRYDG